MAVGFAVALAGCQTSKVTLLADEGGATVGKVAVLDKRSGAERGELTQADFEAKAGTRSVKARKSRQGGFASLFGIMPKPFIRTLYFENDSLIVAERSKVDLAQLLEFWTKEREISDLVIIGHSDSTGEEAANQELSMRRAEAVLGVLQNQGFKLDGNIKVVGRGELDPLPGHLGNDLADEENRRVEIVIR